MQKILSSVFLRGCKKLKTTAKIIFYEKGEALLRVVYIPAFRFDPLNFFIQRSSAPQNYWGRFPSENRSLGGLQLSISHPLRLDPKNNTIGTTNHDDTIVPFVSEKREKNNTTKLHRKSFASFRESRHPIHSNQHTTFQR